MLVQNLAFKCCLSLFVTEYRAFLSSLFLIYLVFRYEQDGYQSFRQAVCDQRCRNYCE